MLLSFLNSAFTFKNPFISTEGIFTWIHEQIENVHVEVNRIPFKNLKKWTHDKKEGTLRHETGDFFAISGINVQTNWGNIPKWEQPIIKQPEIGYLGFITQEFDGILYFLMQAKIEPGNVNHVQLAPTLQATKSNYT